MKKVIIITMLVIFIPYIIVINFMKEEEMKFYFNSNQMVRVKREKSGTIERIPFELYIKGVLSGEMPTSFHIEALKAQAVAARSYVLKKMEQNKNAEYDVVDTVSNQVYLSDAELKEKWKESYASKINKISKAVLETSGEYLSYQGEIAEAFFFSTSTGVTENSEEVFQEKLPYLRSVESTWDQEVSPVFQEVNRFSITDFYQKLGLEYQENLNLKITKATSTGRVKELIVNDKLFSAGDFYQKLGIRSTYFTVSQQGTEIIVTTKGYGHGVGMSQYGAEGMAQSGYKYDQILKHYYQGVEIKKI